MKCRTCSKEIPPERLRALPNVVQCIECVRAEGDEPRVRGHMIWDHKTAPRVEIGTRLAAERRSAHPRQSRGFAFTRFSAPASLDNYERINIRRARCHPERIAVTPSGKCLECSIEWYKKRIW